MFKKSLIPFNFALVLLCAFVFGSPGAEAAPIGSFGVENYTDCTVEIAIRITCPGGKKYRYYGSIAPGGSSSGTGGIIDQISAGPGYDPVLDPNCNIDIIVRVNGNTFSASGTTNSVIDLVYCCTTPPPGGCTVSNNCTSLRWSPYGLSSFPGC